MKIRDILLGTCLGFGAAAFATAPNPDWMAEAIDIYLPESTIVRHPIDTGKYYLCWTDGANRHGAVFRPSELDKKLKQIGKGKRIPVASLMVDRSSKGALVPWSSNDSKVCWPQ